MFRFKQFSVEDDTSTMKVGTDAVLLGAWVDTGTAKTILDVGTGCGVIALMLAQRSNALVDAVEPDEGSSKQASENFSNSPFADRCKAFHTTIQEFHDRSYDLIVSNPPFFSRSLLPPSAGRKAARHTGTLSFDHLLASAKRLLDPRGKLAVILPVVEGNEFRERATTYGLHCVRSLAFYSRRDKPQERWLMEFTFASDGKENQSETLVLYGSGDQWSEDYRRLTADYYL